jgi:hypothetical protein
MGWLVADVSFLFCNPAERKPQRRVSMCVPKSSPAGSATCLPSSQAVDQPGPNRAETA